MRIIGGSVSKARMLRRKQTTAEFLLWRRIRNRQLHSLKFRRQVPMHPYTIDFLCMEKKLIIELDSPMHAWNKTHDKKRDSVLRKKGFQILRIQNSEIKEHMASALEKIKRAAGISPSIVTEDSPLP